ncbi:MULTISPECIES: AI-2E family transporter [Sinorhizobium]|uniref:AI-2E family transporter n=2 Tax=Sinorhizobium TaxID=28105 RepID=A0A2S3YI41_9HYPH|nr:MULTISPECIES: AI-2E family transporter [Sinorhizobium]ASY55376.1 transport protein [Sinorhizobium sp. CCBAU 05631]AUX75341.1 permease protein [Sinorhizobium fredii]PDT40808.1 AI-2E family transporter [Sinorhizobium sp. FG01]PDT52102.1 AI-2E family transporter [Sinorhizobium sp. NG07B]POH26408.1 AI-2E family transporter [Sinorhizobium americanum]
MDAKSVAAVRNRKRNADKEIALAEATKAAAQKRDGMDLVVAGSIVGLFVLACSAAVYTMAAILMPIAFAIVVGIVLGRAADELARFGLPPMLGGLLLALFFVLGLSSLVNALLGPITEVAREAPRLAEGVVERVLPFIERFEWGRIALERSIGAAAFADVIVKNAGPILGAAAASVTPALIQTLIFLAALVLFLLGRVHLRSTIILAFPSREGRLSAIRIMNAIEDGLARYFSTASLIYLALGGFTMMIALIGSLPMPPLWGLFAFVSSFIPYLGVTFMTLSLLVGGLMIHDALVAALAPAAGFFLIHLAMENLVVPAILGRRFEINPFLIFVAILFWTWMWGAVGAILAMPLSLIAMTIFEQLREATPEPQLPG